MRVSEIMTKDVITVKEDTPISDIAELLFDRNLTGVPVVSEDGRIVGIITEYDLMSDASKIHIPTYINLLTQLKMISGDTESIKKNIDDIKRIRAEDIMTSPVVTISKDAEVAEAARIFTRQRINPLPVVDGAGVLQGIISRADIVKLFHNKLGA